MTKEKTYQEKLENLNPKKAIERGRSYFAENEYGEKLRKYSGQIGTKIVYYSLLLYYAFKSSETPKKAKLTIAGALGYLILPLDVIPDFIPAVGFADDSAVIIYAVYQVLSHIDEEVKGHAKARMEKIFGYSVDVEKLQDPLEEIGKK